MKTVKADAQSIFEKYSHILKEEEEKRREFKRSKEKKDSSSEVECILDALKEENQEKLFYFTNENETFEQKGESASIEQFEGRMKEYITLELNEILEELENNQLSGVALRMCSINEARNWLFKRIFAIEHAQNLSKEKKHSIKMGLDLITLWKLLDRVREYRLVEIDLESNRDMYFFFQDNSELQLKNYAVRADCKSLKNQSIIEKWENKDFQN